MYNSIPIFSAHEIKIIDAYTILHEPITSIDLMERAAIKCTDWILKHYVSAPSFKVFCGLGNNGGDGLAIARLLIHKGFTVDIYIVNYSKQSSPDFLNNKNQLEVLQHKCIHEINSHENIPNLHSRDVIIDAIFGIGLTKPLVDLSAAVVNTINLSRAKVISIDVPSGLFIDKHSNTSQSIINANDTLTFQFPKLSFLFSENEKYIGNGHVLDIDLIIPNEQLNTCNKFYLTTNTVKKLLKPRKKFSHKGTFGHSLLIAGSYGKIGAAILASKSLLRSGAGLLTVCLPKCGYEIIQTAVPEAMITINGMDVLQLNELDLQPYSAIGIGPGLGIEIDTQNAVRFIIENSTRPLVIDADALNAISLNKDWIPLIPENSILTPHPKEFERLTKPVSNDFERHQLQLEFSKKNKHIVILKGAHTCITTPDGKSYFNSSGNSGLAKGGSGDVLTGIITGLLGQGYTPIESSILGVFIHGLAGDITKKEKGEIAMIPSDVVLNLSSAFKLLVDDHI
jgi:NAD(P)H-hydrate epimerase